MRKRIHGFSSSHFLVSFCREFLCQLTSGARFFVRLGMSKGMIMAEQNISGNFMFTDTSIEDMKIVGIKAYGDDRGYFMETYKRLDSIASGIDCEFVQGANRLQRVACCAGCIFRSSTRRRSSCVLFWAGSLM